MSGEDLLVRIDAETTGYERSIARAEAQTHSFEYALRRANAAAAENAKNLAAQTRATEQLGKGMFIAGGVIAAGLGLAVKAAIDWESQWTSVLKVLNGTPEELDAVEQGIRDLSLELPTTHEELAQIAASAGALGIATPHIVEFTKTIAELGETTNLVGDEGATTLARFANIMGTSQGEIDNVASSLVALGNSGASTESEIAALGLRIAAAGHNAGLSEGEVLGLANAMSSLGIEAEAGGTAISLTFQMIDKAVKTGGASVQGFADVAGVSIQKFIQLYGHDAAGALTLFLDGLGRIKDSGGNIYQVLNDLGISGQRQIDTLTRLAGAGDLVSASLKTGVVQYEKNIALTNEFAKRNETTAAAMERARNAAVDFAIDLGQTLLPAVGTVAEDLSGMLKFLNGMPGPLKEVTVILTAAAAALLLVGGGTLYARVKLAQLRVTMNELNATGTGMSKSMLAARAGVGAFGAGLAALSTQVGDNNHEMQGLLQFASAAALGFAVGGPWGAAIGGGVGLLTVFAESNARAAQSVKDLTETLDAQTGAVTANSRQWAASILNDTGITDTADKFGISLNTLTKAALGNAEAMREVDAATADALDTQNRALGEGSVGEGSLTGGSFTDTGPVADVTGDAQDVVDAVSAINDILAQSREQWRLQQEVAKAAGEDSVAALDGTKVAAYDAQVGVDALTQSLQDLNDELTQRGSQRAFQAAIDDARKSLNEHGRTLDIDTEAGRANAAALDTIASSALELAQNTVKSTGSLEEGRKVLQGARDDLYAQARAFGMSKQGARDYVDEVLKIPREWKTKTTLDTDAAKQAADLVKAYIENLNPVMDVSLALGAATGAAAAALYGGKHKADGGLILGPGGPRDDTAGLYALSNREFVHNAAAVDYYGVSFMESINRRAIPRGRMADGGTPGGGGDQSLFTLARLIHLLARPEDLTSIKDVNDLIHARNREERQLTEALKDQTKARDAERDALMKARDALHDANSDKAKAEAEKHLADVREAQDKKVAAAEKEVADQRDDLANATDKWREAQQALLEQAKQFAATVSTLGDAFGGEGTSVSAQGLLAKKLAAGDAGKEFETYLRVLKRKHLDDDLILELRNEGPTSAGLALAKSLAESGQKRIRELNRADDRLDRVARDVGTFGVGGSGRHGHGGKGHDGPLVNIEKMVANNADEASKAIEKRQRKALAVARLG